MAILDIHVLFASLSGTQRVIGVDLGTKTIGLALSDVRRRLSSPYAGIKRRKLSENAEDIGTIALQEGVFGLVVGLPLSMDGTVGPAAQAARDWTHALISALGLPAAMWDERLSSAAVNRSLIQEGDMTRARRASVVDRAAASWMLQGALDAVAERLAAARE